VCKESAPPHSDVGTNQPWCTAGALGLVNIYDPITIPTGLKNPKTDFRKGADADTMSDWDRIRCRDGQLFATGWYRKYTPGECARLCAKIHNFYGKTCTHFSRQWIQSKIPEHDDNCGRDGDTIPAGTPANGGWASAGTGSGSYLYRGQCIFFNSVNNECCATKAAWREAGTNTDDGHCETKYPNDRKDAWDSKHRSWRLLTATQAFTPTEAWPVTSLGRRLSDEANHKQYDGEGPEMHEIFFPNGTRFWVEEQGIPLDELTDATGLATESDSPAEQLVLEPLGRRLMQAATDAWQGLTWLWS